MSISSAKSGGTGISLALDNNFMEPIASTLVGSGGTSIITFNDIPQTYKHLQIRGVLFGASTGTNLIAQFNSDSGNNYKGHYIYADGSAVSAGVAAALIGCNISYISSGNASYADAFIFDLLDYTNTNKYKTTRNLEGRDMNGAGGHLELISGLWMNTAAVSSISIVPTSAVTIGQYSRFSLYGIKG